MTDLISLASEIQRFCEQNNWKFCFIGGLALQYWGEQRLTKDIDLSLFVGFGDEETFIDALLGKFVGRIETAKDFALRNRVVLLKTDSGIGIDISLGAFPFVEVMTQRAKHKEYLPGISLKICSAEDLIVSKAFANREKDWTDIRSVLIRNDDLDWNYVWDQLAPLVELKEEPEILEKLEKLRSSLG